MHSLGISYLLIYGMIHLQLPFLHSLNYHLKTKQLACRLFFFNRSGAVSHTVMHTPNRYSVQFDFEKILYLAHFLQNFYKLYAHVWQVLSYLGYT